VPVNDIVVLPVFAEKPAPPPLGAAGAADATPPGNTSAAALGAAVEEVWAD
jgi:hypothetical protein